MGGDYLTTFPKTESVCSLARVSGITVSRGKIRLSLGQEVTHELKVLRCESRVTRCFGEMNGWII